MKINKKKLEIAMARAKLNRDTLAAKANIDEDERKERRKFIPIILSVATAFLSIVVLVLLWKIADYLINERKNLDFRDRLQNSVVIADEEVQDGETDNGEAEDEKK